MRILFLASWWPTRVHPTHGNFVQKHARLVGRRHELTVVAIQEDPTLSPGEQETVSKQYPAYLEVIVYFGRSSRTSPPRNFLNRLRAYRTGIQCLDFQAQRPAVIHAHVMLDAGIMGGLLAWWWDRPLLISEHSSLYASATPISSFRLWLIRWAARRARLVLPVSEALQRALLERGVRARYAVVPNVVDARLFTPPVRDGAESRIGCRFLHVSNFDARYKNVAGLLRAFSIACREAPGLHLHVAGDGDLDLVRRWSSEAGVPARHIAFSGPHTEAEVAQLMQGADAFVHFSNYETQGVVLLEAQLCGLPVIATAVGGIPEILEEGKTGYLVDAADERQFAHAMVKLRNHHLRFDPGYIRERALCRYGESAVEIRLDHLYHEVLLSDQ